MESLLAKLPILFTKKYQPSILETLYPENVSDEPNNDLLQDRHYYVFRHDVDLIRAVDVHILSGIDLTKIIDLGCGDPSALYHKSIPLCAKLECNRYIGIDGNPAYISANRLFTSKREVEADLSFISDDIFSISKIKSTRETLVALLGHTIGALPSSSNYGDAKTDLSKFFDQDIIQNSGGFLCTFDLTIDPAKLLQCYGGPETQKFLTNAWNSICGADPRLSTYKDHGRPSVNWSSDRQEIQFGIEITREIQTSFDNETVSIQPGETLVIGRSRRYGDDDIQAAAESSGLQIRRVIKSSSHSVCMYLFVN